MSYEYKSIVITEAANGFIVKQPESEGPGPILVFESRGNLTKWLDAFFDDESTD